jgi:Peptidase family S41
VRDAKNDAEFVQAVGAMLSELSDPATRVVQVDAKPVDPTIPLHRLDGDVLVLNLGAHAVLDGRVWSLGSTISQEVAQADRVVIDLRGAQDDAGVDYVLRNSALTVAAVPVPPMLLVVHSGYAPQDGMTSGGYYSALQLVPSPTATLIDERAISHAEHSCLFFEAANGTTFIGTHTAGANGDVTNFPLPGGFRVMFTGHDVRHADGRQLQRIGIVPHIAVELTIRGLREGKDEVLERGIAWANEVTRGQ